MSTLLTSNGSYAGNGYLVMSDTEASESALASLSSDNTRFHSDYANCIKSTAINYYPSPTSTINTYIINGGADMKYITFATPSSSGIYSNLFSSCAEEGVVQVKQYYVYNSGINKTIFLCDEFEVNIDVGLGHITNFIGTDLKIGYGYNNIDSAYLTSVGLYSVETNTIGMEFINNAGTNTLIEIITNFSYNTADKDIRVPIPTASNDVELLNGKLSINGVSITNTPVIGISNMSTPWVSHKPFNAQSINSSGNHYSGDYSMYMQVFNHIHTPVTYSGTKLTGSILAYTSLTYPYTFKFIDTYMYPRAKWVHRWRYNDSATFNINRSDSSCIIMLTTSSKNANILIFYPYYYTDTFPLKININLGGGVTAYVWTELKKSGNIFTFVEHSTSTTLETSDVKFLILEYYKY